MGGRRQVNVVGQQPAIGQSRGTARAIMREQFGRSDLTYPETRTRAHEDVPGTLYCPRCHAISTEKRWFLNEDLYQKLKADPQAQAVICPGCDAVERQLYDGEVLLRSPVLKANKEVALNLIHNEEARMREDNPLVRLASVEDRGDEIYILTINQSLAQRIGKAFQSAFHGKLEIQNLPGEQFSRVRWTKED